MSLTDLPLKAIDIQESVLTRFHDLLAKGRLAHAYLFVGPAGIGKMSTALAVAKMIQCETPDRAAGQFFCGVCPGCVKIASASHPDVMVTDQGEEASIKIEQIRGLLSRARLRSFYGRRKVFIVRNAEVMTTEASNAFLKNLEEPSSDTLIILTTGAPEANLDTIRSRCQMVYFHPIGVDELAARLKRDGWEEKEAHFLAYYAEGCPGQAKQMREAGIFQKKKEWLDDFLFSECGDDWIKDLTNDKGATRDFLAVLRSWVRDGLLLKTGTAAERLMHRDLGEALTRFAARYSFRELEDFDQEIIKGLRLLQDGFNVRVQLNIIRMLIKRD
ncbi:MAG: DNA polymerase III subunit delta' [Candidatus Omnitrophica bacterium]|nr:DNA polymerase III subunit delta' [Candidatus Omnitrophota bacterium]